MCEPVKILLHCYLCDVCCSVSNRHLWAELSEAVPVSEWRGV